MNQCLSRRWALPPHLRPPSTRSPRPSSVTGRPSPPDRRGDPLQHVAMRHVDGREPRRRRFRQDHRHVERARPHDDRPAAARCGARSAHRRPGRRRRGHRPPAGTMHPARRHNPAGSQNRSTGPPRPASASIKSASSSARFSADARHRSDRDRSARPERTSGCRLFDHGSRNFASSTRKSLWQSAQAFLTAPKASLAS